MSLFLPRVCTVTQIATYECTTARINGAKPSTIDAWQCFLFNIRDCIKGVTCFLFLLSFPLSLPFDWTFEILSICLLYCYILDVMLCMKIKKMLITKKKKSSNYL